MNQILVTGGAGFIGSHFVEALMSAGHEVLVLDNLSTGSPDNLPRQARLEAIPLESDQAMALLRTFRPESIFHFAAQVDVRVSTSKPVYDAQQNIINSLRLLEAGLQYGLGYFAFASSGGAIYGEPMAGPQDEHHPERPLSPYGVAKLSVDKYLASFTHCRGLKSCSMRFSNVYGPRQNGRGETGVVAVLVRKALGGLPLRVNGDGNQTRDFIYVKDLARAASLILGHRPQGVLNFGTGVETSIRHLVDLVRSEFPGNLEIQRFPGIPEEQRRSVLDSTKAKQVLGWVPATPLADWLKATIQWFSNSESSAPSDILRPGPSGVPGGGEHGDRRRLRILADGARGPGQANGSGK